MSTKTTATVPAYLALVAQLLEVCDEVGAAPLRAGTTSTLPENSGYCFLRFGDANSAALIIPKAAASVKLCDIHIDASDTDGWVDLRKPNGRVMGHIDPASVSDWKDLIARLVGASKRPTVRASKAASAAPVVQDMSAFLAKLQGLGSGTKPVTTPADDSQEEALNDAMLQTLADSVDSI